MKKKKSANGKLTIQMFITAIQTRKMVKRKGKLNFLNIYYVLLCYLT